ncbi:MAG: hypothetical protein R2753_09230 [Chitinophagales bacterium]
MIYWSLLAYYIECNKPVFKQAVLFPLLFIIMNAHPLIILAFTGSSLIVSGNLRYWNRQDQKLLIPIAIGFYFLSRIIFTTNYESHLITRISINSLSDVNVYLFRVMISQIIRQYFPFIVIAIIGLYLILKRHSLWKAILIIGLFVLQFFLIYLRFYDHFIIDTFYEIYLSLIAFLLILSFALHINKWSNRLKNATWTLVILLCIVQVGRTLLHAQFYKERIAIYEDLFAQMKIENISKAVLPFYKAPMSKIIDTYDTPFETYLLSQIDTDKNNNGYIISYWLKDSIDINNFSNYSLSFFRYDKDSISVFPFEDYPKLDILEQPYGTFNAVYKKQLK